MQDIQYWLNSLGSNGVQLGIKELLHYQSQSRLIDLNPRRAVQAKLAGTYLAKTKGRGMEFDEARHYQAGDDIRAIDWRVTARTGKTHTKLYREEKERPVFILVDLSQSMRFGTQFVLKSIQAAHLGALIAWSAAKRGDRIGGLVYNDEQHREFKPFTRQKAVLSLLHGMVSLHEQTPQSAAPQVSFGDACARLRRLARPGSQVYLISDMQKLNASAKQHLSHISRHSEIIAYQIGDPFEAHLPKVAVAQKVALSDGKQQQNIMLGERKTYQQYEQQYQSQQQQIVQQLQQCRARHIEISAAEPLKLQLQPKKREQSA